MVEPPISLANKNCSKSNKYHTLVSFYHRYVVLIIWSRSVSTRATQELKLVNKYLLITATFLNRNIASYVSYERLNFADICGQRRKIHKIIFAHQIIFQIINT